MWQESLKTAANYRLEKGSETASCARQYTMGRSAKMEVEAASSEVSLNKLMKFILRVLPFIERFVDDYGST